MIPAPKFRFTGNDAHTKGGSLPRWFDAVSAATFAALIVGVVVAALR